MPEVHLTPEERRSEPEEPRGEPESRTEPGQQGESESGGRGSGTSPSGDERSQPERESPGSTSPQSEAQPGHEVSPPGTQRRQSASQTPQDTHSALDRLNGMPAPPVPPTYAPPEPPSQVDRLTSPTLEEALAINFDNLRVRDGMCRTTTEATLGPHSREPTPTNGNLASSDNPVPGWQSVPMGVGSDTPVRSESSEENPLTPRNDSGPLAFDGRAGMQRDRHIR